MVIIHDIKINSIMKPNQSFVLIILLIINSLIYAQENASSGSLSDTTKNAKSNKGVYQGIIEGGYCWGIGEWGQSVFRMNLINSIRFGHYAVGAGTGFSILNKQQNEHYPIRFKYMVPVYLDNRLFFAGKNIQYHLDLGVGISFVSFDMLADLSLFLNASTGIGIRVSDKIFLVVGIYGESFNIRYESEDPPKNSVTIGPTIGISF